MRHDPPVLDVIACSPAGGDDVVREALVRADPAPGREILLLTSAALDELDRRLSSARLGAVIHVGRVDLTRQAIRWLHDEAGPHARYDAEEINRRLGILLADRARWTEWWRARRIAPVTVTHEALDADPGRVAGVLQAELGLPGPVTIGAPTTDAIEVDRWLAHHCRFPTCADEDRRQVVELEVSGARFHLEVDPDDFVGREIVLTGRPYEADLLASLARRLPRTGGRVLDVGAHIGNHTIALAALGHEVVAVEPNPRSRALLEANIDRNGLRDRVTVHGVAAGARPGAGTLVVDADNSGATRVTPGDGPIPIRRLDDLVDDVDLVKLDVEGHETAALEGAHRLLSVARPDVVAEAHDDAALSALAGTLALHGYRTDGVSLASDPTYLFTAAADGGHAQMGLGAQASSTCSSAPSAFR